MKRRNGHKNKVCTLEVIAHLHPITRARAAEAWGVTESYAKKQLLAFYEEGSIDRVDVGEYEPV